jgi:hypothetical protein
MLFAREGLTSTCTALRRAGPALALAALVLGFAQVSQATPIAVENAGFEHDVFGDTGGALGIHGWTGSGVFGTYNPVAAQYPGGVPEGDHIAFHHNTSVPVSQVLADALTAGTTYTLQVDVGNRLDLSSTGYSIGLYAGGVLLAQDASSIVPPDGGFSTASVVYEALAGNPLLGQLLEIRLGSGGTGIDFDNVRLDAEDSFAPVPEPNVALLMAAGLGGLALHTRRAARRAR